MGHWRKKPVVIEAVRFEGVSPFGDIETTDNEKPTWLVEATLKPVSHVGSVARSGTDLRIYTLEGEHRAEPGDWIIRGIKGELYPCKPDIFAATYDPAVDPDHTSDEAE